MLLSDTGVAKRTQAALAAKKIYTVDQLLRHIPRKYRDYRVILPLKDAIGKDCAIAGYVESVIKDNARNRVSRIEIKAIEESSGATLNVTYFGNTFLWNYLKNLEHTEAVFCGSVAEKNGSYYMSNPYKVSDKDQFKGYIVPVYPKIKGVSEDMLKKLIKQFITNVEDPIDENVIKTAHLLNYKSALMALHYPKDPNQIKQGQKRLAFNDLLYFSMELQEESRKIGKNGVKISSVEETIKRLDNLSFQLTQDQASTLNHIRDNMKAGIRTDALVQGDVGCGKTIVAFLAMSMMAENGYQSVIMAPTEVLARQHFEGFCKTFPDLASRAVYLAGSVKAKEKKSALGRIVTGDALFVIGTHSVISENVMFLNLGLIVTDEEHRFGTEQRKILSEKGNEGAHVISMSATPIPRSIATAIYGESKSIYEIKSMPAGRIPIQTAINNNQQVIFDFVEKQLKNGRQVYVVCPLVEEAEEDTIMDGIDSVDEVYEKYRLYFETLGYKTGKLFGKQNQTEKSQAISDFETNKTQLLVSTTVIEVGVNVPNASLIVIHNAERFGLATLHQLRGRVGRGGGKAYCILKSALKDNERLLTMVNTNDGFKIAEEDLKQRGAGDLIGTKQSGKNHSMELMLSLPNFYNAVKKYAAWMLDTQKAQKLIDLYKTNQESLSKVS